MQELIKSHQRNSVKAKLNNSDFSRPLGYFNAFPHTILSPSR